MIGMGTVGSILAFGAAPEGMELRRSFQGELSEGPMKDLCLRGLLEFEEFRMR